MAEIEAAIIALIFLMCNLIEPILGIPTLLSYMSYFSSYTPTTNVTQSVTQLTSTVTGAVIQLPSVIIDEIIDSIVSGVVGIILAMLLDLSGGGEGGRTVHFSDGRTVTFRNR